MSVEKNVCILITGLIAGPCQQCGNPLEQCHLVEKEEGKLGMVCANCCEQHRGPVEATELGPVLVLR